MRKTARFRQLTQSVEKFNTRDKELTTSQLNKTEQYNKMSTTSRHDCGRDKAIHRKSVERITCSICMHHEGKDDIRTIIVG
jgi:hypothetical protein